MLMKWLLQLEVCPNQVILTIQCLMFDFSSSDESLSSKLLTCLLTFGRLSEAWELYRKLSVDGSKLRLGTIEALARASIAQNKLSEVLPLLEVLGKNDNKLEPLFAQELLTAALDNKVAVKLSANFSHFIDLCRRRRENKCSEQLCSYTTP